VGFIFLAQRTGAYAPATLGQRHRNVHQAESL
jgi:hypothetical protein